MGNKAELEEQREVQFDTAVEFAKTNGIQMVFETSAKTGNGVEDVFKCAIKNYYNELIREVNFNA